MDKLLLMFLPVVVPLSLLILRFFDIIDLVAYVIGILVFLSTFVLTVYAFQIKDVKSVV